MVQAVLMDLCVSAPAMSRAGSIKENVMPASFAADVYCLKKTNTGTNKLEVHVLNRIGDFQSLHHYPGTALSAANAAQNFTFGLADFNRNGFLDLYCLKKANTASGMLEVHIMEGALGYSSISLSLPTPIEAADATQHFAFALADYNGDGIPDLFCLKKSNTGTGRLEVHVLNGADSYRSYLLQTPTPIYATDSEANFKFALGDYDNDGHPDIYCLKTRNTGTGFLQVHVLAGADGYQSFLFQDDTPIGSVDADDNFEFGVGDYQGNNNYDVFCMKKMATGTDSFQVHVLSRADDFRSFLLQTDTVLGQADAATNFAFYVGHTGLPGVGGAPGA
jgi:hypothetical protein